MSVFKELMDISVEEAIDGTNRKFSIYDMFLQCSFNVTEDGVPKTIYEMLLSDHIIVDEAIIEELGFNRAELVEYLKSSDWDKSELYVGAFKEDDGVFMPNEDFETLLSLIPSPRSEKFKTTVNEIKNVMIGYEEYEVKWKLHNKNRESVITQMPYNFGDIHVLGLYKYNEVVPLNRWRLLSQPLDKWEEAERLMFEQTFNLELVHKWVNVSHTVNLALAVKILNHDNLILMGDSLSLCVMEKVTDDKIISIVDKLVIIDNEAQKILATTSEYDSYRNCI